MFLADGILFFLVVERDFTDGRAENEALLGFEVCLSKSAGTALNSCCDDEVIV